MCHTNAEELKELYGLFGLSVANNVEEVGLGPKQAYLAEVVYGDLLHFIGDSLRDISSNVKFGRGHDLLIVDEVDNMFIDQNNMRVQLSSTTPGFDLLSQLFVYMRGAVTSAASMLIQKGDECFAQINAGNETMNLEELDIELIENVQNDTILIPIGKSCKEHIWDYIDDYSKNDLFAFEQNRNERIVTVPSHLEDFVKIQADKWINSLFNSFLQEEKTHYLVNQPSAPDPRKFKVIAPIDYENTGNIQHRLQWSNGLHPFLQVKHGLTLSSENVISVYMSHDGFFKKYFGDIYGVTGTLGSEASREFLEQNYGVETFVMPTFVNKDLSIFPGILVSSGQEWLNQIVKSINLRVANQRAALVIVETIAEVENVKEALIASNYSSEQIFIYGTGAKKLEYDVESKRKLMVGDVIIATNMAGRGTDLKISHEVKKNGGLHVIMGIFSDSLRVQEQGFGRAARQGEPGSAQIIANAEKMPETKCVNDLKCLEQERDAKEFEKLQEDKLCKLPRLAMQDQLFDDFVELRKEIDSPTGFKLFLGETKTPEPRSLYLYSNIENDDIFLKIIPDQSTANEVKILNINDMLNAIDSFSAKHIKVTLREKHKSISYLSSQDSDIVHFIAAINGFSEHKAIYERVKEKYIREVEAFEKRELYDVFTKKKTYLEHLLLEKEEFQDLLSKEEITKTDLANAELRQKYFLWLEDRAIYNNHHENQQVKENWGIFLKKFEHLFNSNDCDVKNPEKVAQENQNITNYLKNEFREFKKEIIRQHNSDNLMTSPYYNVIKAWKLLEVHEEQKSREPEFNFFSIASPPPANALKTYFDIFMSGIQTAVDYVFPNSELRVELGGENYAPKTPLDSAISSLKKAKQLDNIHSWQADNAKAYISLIKNGAGITKVKQADRANQVKTDFYYDSVNTLKKIQNNVIPQYESQLAYLKMNKMANFSDEIAIQLIGTIEIYNAFAKRTNDNIETVVNSPGDHMIAIDKHVPLEDLVQNINITQAVLQAMNGTSDFSEASRNSFNDLVESINLDKNGLDFVNKDVIINQIGASGGIFLSIQTNKLDEDKNWFGTVFAAVIGIASVCTGMWMLSAATSTFGTVLGTSMVMQGIGDVMQAGISVARGVPIDMDNYLNAKGMSMGIAIATAGIMQFASTIPAFSDTIASGVGKLNDAFEGGNFLRDAVIIQATTMAVSEGIYQISKDMVEDEDLATDVEDEVNSIIKSMIAQLNKIFATDKLNSDRDLLRELNGRVDSVVNKYMRRFNDDGTKFAVGTAGSVAGHVLSGMTGLGGAVHMGNLVNSVTKLAMGGVKNADAMRKIAGGVRDAINEVAGHAMNSERMMEVQLVNGFGRKVGAELFSSLSEQAFITAGEIDYGNCDKLREIQLPADLAGRENGLVSTCNRVASDMLNDDASKFDQFSDRVVAMVSRAIGSIKKHEIARPLSDAVAAEAGEHFGKKIVSYINAKQQSGEHVEQVKISDDKFVKKAGLEKHIGREKAAPGIKMPKNVAVVENAAGEERVEQQMSPIDGSWGQEMYGVKNHKMSRGEFYESMKKRLDWQIAGDKLDGWQLERYKDEAYGHYLAGRDDSYSVAGYALDRFGGWVESVEANGNAPHRLDQRLVKTVDS